MARDIKETDFIPEFEINATRSSGPGGQNVNKVNTRIELRFNVSQSGLLNDEEKIRISKRLAGKISKEGILIIVSQSERSQLKNKEEAIRKFYEMISQALKTAKKRRATSPSPGSVRKRLEEKQKHGEKKTLRSQSRIKPDDKIY